MQAYGEYFRSITEPALKGAGGLGKDIFIYPYVYRPIVRDCALLPGVNHYLSLGIHGIGLPNEPGLPNAMLVVIPKVMFLFCDGDLATARSNTMKAAETLTSGGRFDPLAANADMPAFIAPVLNRAVGGSQGHQKALNRWRTLATNIDRQLNPRKVCYLAREHDRQLAEWQSSNCP